MNRRVFFSTCAGIAAGAAIGPLAQSMVTVTSDGGISGTRSHHAPPPRVKLRLKRVIHIPPGTEITYGDWKPIIVGPEGATVRIMELA